MKNHLSKIILVTFLLLNSAEAQIRYKIPRLSLFEQDTTILTDSLQTIFQLPDSFLIAETDTVWLDSTRLQPEQDYFIDWVRGRFVCRRSIPAGKMLRIKYKYLPIRLPLNYYHQRLQPLVDKKEHEDSVFQLVKMFQPPDSKQVAASTTQLRKNGSIVRGISVGSNQGLKLDSGLRMQITGRIANKVDVIAALTDQNTPIQPEGNTQSLQEIDKVFVKIKSEHFDANLGDYFLQFNNGEFGKYSRKLQGAMGTARFKNIEITLSGALAKGQYTTNQFTGSEGNQGPYQLKGKQGQTDIIVIAGTENVWINGEHIKRGETNDYVIEYGNGQITFTRSRLITDESRITVDFQYSDQKFRRNLYGGRVKANFWRNKLQVTSTFVHEADDKSNPLDFTLTDENLNRLTQAGDAMDSAYVSSANFVGEFKGAYVRVDSADFSFFRYVGDNKGNYRVGFSFVGYGKGDYQLQGFGKYRFVEPGKGSYIAKVLLSPARSQSLINLNVNFRPVSAFHIRQELALSDLDQNSYSKVDDDDNQGFAYKFQLDARPGPVKYLGQLALKGKLRYINPQFRQIDRTTEVEYNRRWDLGTGSTVQEQTAELSANYLPRKNWEFNLNWGQIEKGADFQSKRYEFTSQLKQSRFPAYQYRLESIESRDVRFQRQGEWLRQRGKVDYGIWKIRPHFGFEQEIKKDSFADSSRADGFRFDQVSGGLAALAGKKISLFSTFSQRKDQQWLGEGFTPQSEAVTQHYQMKVTQIKSLSAALNYIHRKKHYFLDFQDKRSDLAEVKLNFSPLKRAITSTWNYQISNTQSAKRERQYLEVPEGEGTYRYDADLNEFVPDPLGNYEIRIINTNIFIPVVDLKTSLNLKIDFKRWLKPRNRRSKSRTVTSPKKDLPQSLENANFWDLLRIIPWLKIAGKISSETMIRLEEKTEEEDVWGIYRLNLSKFQGDSTIYGIKFLRQNLYWDKNSRRFSLRFRFQQENSTNRQFVEGGESRLRIERSIQLTSRLSSWLSTQIFFQNQRKRRLFFIPGRENRDIRSRELTVDFSVRPISTLELALKSRLAVDEDQYPVLPTTATLISLIPRSNYSFRTKGRLTAQFEWTQVKADKDILPYEMVYGNAPGLSQRWDVNFSYRISKNVQGSLNYTGRNDKHRGGTIHIGRAEVRAFF